MQGLVVAPEPAPTLTRYSKHTMCWVRNREDFARSVPNLGTVTLAEGSEPVLTHAILRSVVLITDISGRRFRECSCRGRQLLDSGKAPFPGSYYTDVH